MNGIGGKLNTSSVIEFIVTSDPAFAVKENPIKKGSNWTEFGYFYKIDDLSIRSATLRVDDLVNSFSIKLEESKSYTKSKIYVKLPNPSIYNVSEFFLEGHFKFSDAKSHTDGKVVSGDLIKDIIEKGKVVTFANKVFIKKTGDSIIQSSAVETEFGKLVRLKKQVEIDI